MAETNTIIKRLMPFAGHPRSRIHGPAHWARVHRFGQALSEHLDLSRDGTQCVAVFAWTHDLARIDDGGGNQHAHDGASLLDPAWATVFPDLSVEQVELVRTAVRYHSDGLTAEAAYYHGYFDHLGHDDDEVIAIIGCCWDADRLDLLRLGAQPKTRYMSTDGWRKVLPLAERLHQGRSDE
ncbi:MAG: hypothetical protein AMS22_10545 [Thiotrichales bacterium SG8_50]|nr:MAG: hypothetical protein AMS22_10545 [Thiotrichales bacterium SG8_50]